MEAVVLRLRRVEGVLFDVSEVTERVGSGGMLGLPLNAERLSCL
jgi:hypothetical protein